MIEILNFSAMLLALCRWVRLLIALGTILDLEIKLAYPDWIFFITFDRIGIINPLTLLD
jgi:hypothetical protein